METEKLWRIDRGSDLEQYLSNKEQNGWRIEIRKLVGLRKPEEFARIIEVKEIRLIILTNLS